MTKMKDSERILELLDENGLMSNLQVKSRLNMNDDRYEKVRSELLDDGYIQKYQCRGGGIQITKKGEKSISDTESVSAVGREAELYEPFINLLSAECEENGERAVICNTSSLRKRGKWSNPDVVKIASRWYPILRERSLAVITYEIKQANRWNRSSVFEAASHAEFAHESYIVLEWPKDEEFDDDDLIQSCRRFGVGLITLRSHYSSFRYEIQQDAEKRNPSFDLLEGYLDYIFDRLPGRGEEYQTLIKEADREDEAV